MIILNTAKVLFVGLSFIAMLSGCDMTNDVAKNKLSWRGMEVVIEIGKHKLYKSDSDESSLIYGNIVLDRAMKPALNIVNLNCIKIAVGQNKSQKVYVDSVAHIISDNYHLKDKENEIPLYWKMKKIINEEFVREKVNIFIDDACDFLSTKQL